MYHKGSVVHRTKYVLYFLRASVFVSTSVFEAGVAEYWLIAILLIHFLHKKTRSKRGGTYKRSVGRSFELKDRSLQNKKILEAANSYR